MRARTGWLLGLLTLLMELAGFSFVVLLNTFDDPPLRSRPSAILFGLAGLAAALWVGLGRFCLMHMEANQRVPARARDWWRPLLILGAWLTVPHYWWLYLRPGARPGGDPFESPERTQTVSVTASAHAVHQALRAAIQGARGWRILTENEDRIQARVAGSIWSYGEEVTVTIHQDGSHTTVTADVRPLRSTPVDFGKGQKILDTILHAVRQAG